MDQGRPLERVIRALSTHPLLRYFAQLFIDQGKKLISCGAIRCTGRLDQTRDFVLVLCVGHVSKPLLALKKKKPMCAALHSAGHIGLPHPRPPGIAGLPFIQSSNDIDRIGITRADAREIPLSSIIIAPSARKNKCVARSIPSDVREKKLIAVLLHTLTQNSPAHVEVSHPLSSSPTWRRMLVSAHSGAKHLFSKKKPDSSLGYYRENWPAIEYALILLFLRRG